jgi:hypothetical protein
VDRVTFLHFETLIAVARTPEALDAVRAELRDYAAQNPGDPLAGELGERISEARAALAAAERRR